ncbi:MAG: hypothetical protein P4L93_06570 [Coriobacteriia bacterium]|nr:hypothetical protein [Coriobacteriia bacterium]
MSSNAGSSAGLTAVRDALRAELTARGHRVASDTLGLAQDLYIIGANDLARALFHFDDDAGELARSMYRGSGSWVEGMPPRFAVLPSAEAGNPSFEMLEQMRAIPLLYNVKDGRVTFRDLDGQLAKHVGA